MKEVDRFAKLGGSNAEQGVVRTYLDTVLELPWNGKSEERHDLQAAQDILDRDHYGLKKVKERIMEFPAVKALAPELKGQVLCLVGPPGWARPQSPNRSRKRWAQLRAHEPGRRAGRGGYPRPPQDLHRRDAQPHHRRGAARGTANPLILLDEIDKMGSDFRGDPASAMLEVLDTEQNVAFRDHYIELPFDLSDVLFLTTANDLSTVPRPLLDRMEVIELSSYTEEKRQIALHHLLPKQMKKAWPAEVPATLSEKMLGTVIAGYTREAGVRRLETVARQAVP